MVGNPQIHDNHVAPILACKICGHAWQQRGTIPPKRCPRCQTSKWNQGRPTPLELLGLPPATAHAIFDPRTVHLVKTLPELRQLGVDTLDNATWLEKGLQAALEQVHRVQRYMATALDILEGLRRATSPLEMAAAGIPEPRPTPGPEIPAEPQERPPNATTGHATDAPQDPRAAAREPRRPLRIRKSSRSSRRSRGPSG